MLNIVIIIDGNSENLLEFKTYRNHFLDDFKGVRFLISKDNGFDVDAPYPRGILSKDQVIKLRDYLNNILED